ncbi:MAG: NUDIX domain-containing protein [Candidatus Roizmanbacteria bacterium]
MKNIRMSARVAVYGFLMKDKNVFLMRRYNTGFADGNFSVPAGHVEADESITQAMVRELKEETGIDVNENDLHLAHVMKRKSTESIYIDFFFVISKWDGQPHNRELDKCDLTEWCLMDELPQNILGYINDALNSYKEGILFSNVSDS